MKEVFAWKGFGGLGGRMCAERGEQGEGVRQAWARGLVRRSARALACDGR